MSSINATASATDNTANQRVASGAAVLARSKHFLRRYHVLLERVRSREITIGHVPDGIVQRIGQCVSQPTSSRSGSATRRDAAVTTCAFATCATTQLGRTVVLAAA